MAGNAELSVILKLKDEASAELKGFKDKLGTIGPVLKSVGIGILGVATAAIGAGVASVKSFADTGSAIYEMSQKTGISTEALSAYKYAAEQCGASLDTIGMGIKNTANFLQMVDQGSVSAIADLNALGISVDTLKGMSPEQIFDTLSSAIAGIPDPLQRSAIAVDIFGRSGTDLLPMLAEGEDGIAALKAEASDLGLVMTSEGAKSADDMGDALTRVQGAMQGAMNVIAEALIPALMPLIDAFVLLIKALPLKEIGQLISQLLPPLVKLFTDLLAAIPFDVWLKFVGAVLTPLLGIIKALLPALTPIITIFAELLELLTPVVEFIGKILEGVAKLAGGVLGKVFGGISSAIGGIGDFLGIGDGIVQNGQIITTDPADYIIATKTPQTLMGGGGTTINITVNGSVLSENQLIDVVRRGLYRDQAHNYSLGFA